MRILFVLLAFVVLFGFVGRAQADHLTPERVVENTYTVILLMIPEGEQMRLRVLFRDVQSGKNIVVPITYRLSISREASPENILEKKEGETLNGIIEFPYVFPGGGLYEVSLEFEKADEQGKVYRPDTWTLWVPGATQNFFQRYPIGFTEIAGFSALFASLGVVGFSVWWFRAKGKPLEVSFFGIFGNETSKKRRMAAIRQERKKYSQKS